MSEKVIENLRKELDKIGSKELTNQSLDNIHMLSESLYYLTVTRAMEEGEYSEDYMYDEGRYSGRRGQRRDSMGRYAREGMGSSYNSSYNNSYEGSYGRGRGRSGGRYSSERGGGYSEADNMEGIMQDMLNRSTDPKERETIQKMMSQMGM